MNPDDLQDISRWQPLLRRHTADGTLAELFALVAAAPATAVQVVRLSTVLRRMGRAEEAQHLLAGVDAPLAQAQRALNAMQLDPELTELALPRLAPPGDIEAQLRLDTARGLLLARQGRHAEAHRVEIVSKVGAGDSFVAGYTLAVARGMAAPEALGLAAACASAACMTPATELCRPEDVARLYDTRVVTPI